MPSPGKGPAVSSGISAHESAAALEPAAVGCGRRTARGASRDREQPRADRTEAEAPQDLAPRETPTSNVNPWSKTGSSGWGSASPLEGRRFSMTFCDAFGARHGNLPDVLTGTPSASTLRIPVSSRAPIRGRWRQIGETGGSTQWRRGPRSARPQPHRPDQMARRRTISSRKKMTMAAASISGGSERTVFVASLIVLPTVAKKSGWANFGRAAAPPHLRPGRW